MKDFRITGSDQVYPDAGSAIEALRKAMGWAEIHTSATFKASETDDEYTDAVCAYETAEDLAAHSVVFTPAKIEVDPETKARRETAPPTTEATDAPRITWTARKVPRATRSVI